jgi:hypothetical protein
MIQLAIAVPGCRKRPARIVRSGDLLPPSPPAKKATLQLAITVPKAKACLLRSGLWDLLANDYAATYLDASFVAAIFDRYARDG